MHGQPKTQYTWGAFLRLNLPAGCRIRVIYLGKCRSAGAAGTHLAEPANNPHPCNLKQSIPLFYDVFEGLFIWLFIRQRLVWVGSRSNGIFWKIIRMVYICFNIEHKPYDHV